jgi:PAS domain S-box-containing protein
MSVPGAKNVGGEGDGRARVDERNPTVDMTPSERLFADGLIESLPGIVYLCDAQGKFLRWNQNFVTVSGYSSEEIAQMHPLDFFSGDDKRRVAQEIGLVFETGQSTIQAAFLSKNGCATSYFFTGRRVQVHGQACLVGMGIDITERQQADDRLAESERKYRELVEHAQSIILRWNFEGSITFLNAFGERFFGYSTEEVLGRSVLDTIVPPIQSDGRDLKGLMERIRADPTAFEHNVNENIRKDGKRVSIAWTNRIGRNADGDVVDILSIGVDVTEQKRAEAALRASEERYRTTLGSILESCQLIGFDWRYLYLNDAAAIQNRRPNDVLLGRTMMEAWPDIAGTAVFAMLQRTMQERTAHRAEIEFVFPDGSQGWFDVRSQPVPEGIFVLSIDISVRKSAEMALRELNDTLEQKVAARTAEAADARHRAEAADRMKSAFLATMSHELRTPLNSIMGFTGLILEGLSGPLTAEQSVQLGMVQGSSQHLLDLINDVLDLSKIEAGQLEVFAEPFDLRASLEQVKATLKPLADEKGITLTIVVSPSVGEMVSDRRRVEQILLNLCNNAIKFTERGGVTLTADLVVDSRSPDVAPRPTVRIRATDTGIGITPENLATLFRPFRQIDNGGARHEGTGLGLAISQRLAGLLDGEISATSEWLKGSEFTVTIPLRKAL